MKRGAGAASDDLVRFGFGANWCRFLAKLDAARVADAEDSLRTMLGRRALTGCRFLDVGCGSGLFSLAARNLGACVTSFDFDLESVECASRLKETYHPGDERWKIDQGSVLDDTYLAGLGKFDVVYAWGVLHHTGNMRRAIENVVARVEDGGSLFIAIYNDQGIRSRVWTRLKRLYNTCVACRALLVVVFAPYFVGARYLFRRFTGRARLQRGMALWHDLIDWLGGYPFEVASPEVIVDAVVDKGFKLVKIRTCGARSGCNEFVFDKHCKSIVERA